MIQAKRRRATIRRENAGYWMSYSDVMAALLLMLILLLFFYVNQYLSLQERREQELALKEQEIRTQQELLDQTDSLLAQKANELAAAQGLLNNQEVELLDKNIRLEDSLARLAAQQLDIEEQKALVAFALQHAEEYQAQLEAQQETLDAYEAQLSDRDKALFLQQLDVEQLQALLANQSTQLNLQQQQIDQLVGVRAAIVAQMRESLAAANLNVNVDHVTGAITLDSSIVFDYNGRTIKESGRRFLDEFLPIYVRTLLMGENSAYVSELIVEGHTDSVGGYEYNLNLSQQRAYEVVRYCLSDSFTGLTAQEKLILREKLTANGRSFSSLIYRADGTEDAEASRRVEFKFRLKDEEMISGMNQILSGME